jgi:hypothetical protein
MGGAHNDAPSPTSRRDALKLGGVAALGSVAAALAATAAGEAPAEAVTGAAAPLHVPTSLRVTVDGALLRGVRSMSQMSSAYETSSAADASGTWRAAPSGLGGQVVSFSRFFTGDPAFVELYQSQNGNPGQRKTITVTVLGRRGSTANTFTLSECFPVSWTGPTYSAKAMAAGGSADRPIESIAICFQDCEVK